MRHPRSPGDNGHVTELPRRAITRTAKLAGLPLGVAGRAALGAVSYTHLDVYKRQGKCPACGTNLNRILGKA